MSQLSQAVRQAAKQGKDLGHKLGKWHIDTDTSALAECEACGWFAAVDVTRGGHPKDYEPEAIFGVAATLPCSAIERSTANAAA